MREGCGQLGPHAADAVGGQGAARQQLGEGRSVDELHHQPGNAPGNSVVVAGVEDADDVGIVQPPHRRDLAREPALALLDPGA